MSEVEVPRRMRLIAVSAALIAMVFALVAVIVVLTRDNASAKPAAAKAPDVAPLADRTVLATNIARLNAGDVEVVVEAGVTKGVRLKDDILAKDLGLEPDDIITAISGKPMALEGDVSSTVMRLGHMNATVVYAELLRKGQPTLLRWRLDGDLREARLATSSALGSLGSTPSVPPAPDPLLDTIEKVDETHYKLPRATAEKLYDDFATSMKGARIVPSIKNGAPNGLKLYAIRPNSPFARLGFTNGDTVHAINGYVLDGLDSTFEAARKLKGRDELTFDITRRGKSVTLTIQITK